MKSAAQVRRPATSACNKPRGPGRRETLRQDRLHGHVPTYRTLPPGTRINGGTYKVPKFIGSTIIHPYSDFLLHHVGTGDGIPQAAKPEYLDQATANKFRTALLWGRRFRYGLMRDAHSPGSDAAITRHGGEATTVRDRYEHLTPKEKQQLQSFLNSL
jgi:hypothetical protein